jgi:flagellin
MVSAITGNNQAVTQTQASSTTTATAATPVKTASPESSTSTNKSTRSTEAERYTAVQQNLANSKTAVSAATTANKEIDGQLKQVRDIATKLADEKITGKDREKLQADYTKARDSIIASQDKATVKSGTGNNATKTNLLTDAKNQTVSTNTRGGELEVASSKSAKALGLPEKIGSAADAKALLSADDKKAGSLANAEKTTQDTTARLKKADADVSKRLETASLAAKAAQRLETAKTGNNRTLSADEEEKRNQAIEQAKQAREQIKTQFSGLSQNSGNKNVNSLSALFS